jgi:hypothetical protein
MQEPRQRVSREILACPVHYRGVPRGLRGLDLLQGTNT